MKERTYVSFDWALKRILRDKANFDVLEGFLTTLLGFGVRIHRLLESEGNQERADSKYNRVDLLAERSPGGELVLIEVQGEPEFAYFQRMLFGASRLVTDYINGGQNYEHVRKIYSVNIVYFDLGQGDDVVYHGTTEFRGVHTGHVLSLSPYQRQRFSASAVWELYPEYYILKVNDFDRWSRVPLDQWLYFLSTSDIPADADAPGLQQARQKLSYMRMNRDEQHAYERYWMDRHILENTMTTARGEGKLEGYAEGVAKGRAEGMAEGVAKGRAEGMAEGRAEGMAEGMAEGARAKALDIARRLTAGGMSAADAAALTGLSAADVEEPEQ